uniref:DUF834 domain-containing protein n=1 Tax=Oryza barthii TaxID=65489 RepID=A0A0D3EQW2_9ORYZ
MAVGGQRGGPRWSVTTEEGDNRWEKGSTRRALAASERRIERCAAAASSGPLSMLPPSLRTEKDAAASLRMEKDAAAHLGKGARTAKPIPCSCSPPRPNPPWGVLLLPSLTKDATTCSIQGRS